MGDEMGRGGEGRVGFWRGKGKDFFSWLRKGGWWEEGEVFPPKEAERYSEWRS